jgi:hypothetical protein
MPELQNRLRRFLSTGRRPSLRPLRESDIVTAGLLREVAEVFQRLGGVEGTIRINPGSWDCITDGIVVELDETRHFNRYRLTTLDSPIYKQLSSFPFDCYQMYCRSHEAQCLLDAGYGGYWSNPSCVTQFGPGGEPKMLDGCGAPRWKQRAFYDFLKDLSPLALGLPVARISVWDSISLGGVEMSVGTALAKNDKRLREALIDLIASRVGSRSS